MSATESEVSPTASQSAINPPVIFNRLATLHDDPAAMIEATIAHYRSTGRPLELFESLKMRIRNRLSLPLTRPPKTNRDKVTTSIGSSKQACWMLVAKLAKCCSGKAASAKVGCTRPPDRRHRSSR